MKDRVALLTNIPAPYRLPFFRELAKYCDLLVIFDSYTEPNRQWVFSPKELGFRYAFANGFHLPYRRKRYDIGLDEERYLQVRYGILSKLSAFQPHVIVSAEMGLRTMQAAIYCSVTKRPFAIWWEGTPHTEGWVKREKSLIRRVLVKRAKKFWSNGRESTTLLLAYGASSDVVDEGMIGIDTKFFASETTKLLS